MNNLRYFQILKYICSYYEMDESDFFGFIKKKEFKFILLLILKNNNCLNLNDIMEKLGIKNKNTIKRNLKLAEEEFLINMYFRNEYFELEKNINTKINSKL